VLLAACTTSSAGEPSSPASSAEDAGAASACAEPASCPGIDRTVAPEITCASPELRAGVAVTLHLFGLRLQDARGSTKVSFSGDPIRSGNVLNGTPLSPCHLEVDVPAGFAAGEGRVEVRAITGTQSPPYVLDVR
jgi:hypothetical protein